MMLPTFISVSVAPGSYLFWAVAAVVIAASVMMVADNSCSRSRKTSMIDLLALASVSSFLGQLEHDPEKCPAVFPRDKRKAFARRSCSIKNLERDDDSTGSHRASRRPFPRAPRFAWR